MNFFFPQISRFFLRYLFHFLRFFGKELCESFDFLGGLLVDSKRFVLFNNSSKKKKELKNHKINR